MTTITFKNCEGLPSVIIIEQIIGMECVFDAESKKFKTYILTRDKFPGMQAVFDDYENMQQFMDLVTCKLNGLTTKT